MNLHDLHITLQLTKIDNLISIWKLQDMTPYRCITIVKTCLISQFIYKLTLFPQVTVNTKELQNKLDNFVWGLKKTCCPKRILHASYKVGGLNMVNLEYFSLAYESLGFADYIKIFIAINFSLMIQLICCFSNITYMFLIYPVLKLKYWVAGKL